MPEEDDRAQARRRLKITRDFGWHLVTFVALNGLLVYVWSINGGAFWPAWVIVAWGIGLVFHAWYAFFGQPITEADIRREMDRGRRRRDGRHGP